MPQAIERFLKISASYAPNLSADATSVVFLSTQSGLPQVWQVGVNPGGPPLWPDQLTFDADRVQGVWLSPTDAQQAIFARDAGGNENAQLFLYDLESGEITPLTDGFEDAMHTFGSWSEDGSRFLFAANRREKARFDLYEADLEGGVRCVWQNDASGYLYRPSYAPDGRSVALGRVASNAVSQPLEIDLATGSVRPLADADAFYSVVSFANNGKSLLVLTDYDADFFYLARLDLASLELTPLVQLDWDIECAQASPDRSHIAFVVNEGGSGRLYCLDLATQNAQPLPHTPDPDGVAAMMDARLSFSGDGTRLAFSLMGTTKTSDLYLWELEADTVQELTRSAHGGLNRASFVAPKLVHYPTFDDREIPAWYYPCSSQETASPTVVIVHGGPEGQSRPGLNFLAQYLIGEGYAVLVPNVRGSVGYGKTYSHLDDVEKRLDSVADLAHAASWLKAQPGIDADRVAVYGGSYGGFMVLAALTHYPDAFTVGVDIVGISNLVTFLENTSGYRRAHREAEYGSLERDRDFLEAISPMTHLYRVTAPLMVIHGANDPRVPLSEAEQLVAALETRGIETEFLVFEDEGHGIAKLENKLVAYPAIVSFLERHLK